MYNLIEYRNNYSTTSGNLYQFCRDEPNNVLAKSESFKFKSKFLENSNNAGIVDAKIAVPLKLLTLIWVGFLEVCFKVEGRGRRVKLKIYVKWQN